MNVTLKEMKVGTFDNLITAKYDNLLIDILNIFIKQKISSVPVVDEEGAILLAKDGPLYNLQMTIKEALSYRSMMQDTFGQLMETIRNNTVRRFVILDGKKLKGMLSLTDILKYVVELK
ncbi:5'-AMP-activated protein kinase subunit gamma-1 [Boothiomyces sp. JEL0838]|nr:5'-AMP-activated protein kinase subunit gamma-1 [Boothiomyces sp. JEL0838]